MHLVSFTTEVFGVNTATPEMWSVRKDRTLLCISLRYKK